MQAGTLYFADAGQLTPDTVLPTNLLYYGTLPPELADRLTNSAMIDRGEFAVLFQTVKELLSYQQSDQQLYTQVLYMLCNGAELDRVLTKMTDVTGDLFVVIDSTGKLVAKTKNFYVDYPLWMRSIEQGYCSDILMEYIEDRRRKNEYSLSDKPFTPLLRAHAALSAVHAHRLRQFHDGLRHHREQGPACSARPSSRSSRCCPARQRSASSGTTTATGSITAPPSSTTSLPICSPARRTWTWSAA